MSFDELHSQIDEEQDRIDLIDDLDDEQLSGQATEAYFKKLDDYQARIKDSNFPNELKAEQAALSLNFLKEVTGQDLEAEHNSFDQTLDHFNDSLDKLDNKNLIRIEESGTLWGLVQNQIGLNFKENPQKFLAAINFIQKFREEHGSIADIQETGELKWEKTGGSKDQLKVGEYIDINIFQNAEFDEEVEEYVAASEAAIEDEAEQQRAELETILEDTPGAEASTELPSLDELEAAIAERMAGDLDNAGDSRTGLLHFSDADEFQEFLGTLETEDERRELMEHILGNIDVEPPLTEQQEMRLEQVELLTHLYSTLVIELGEQSKTWAQEVASLSVEQEQIMEALSTYEATLANDLPAAAEAIKADPSATLESIMPDRIAKLRTVDDQTNDFAQFILRNWSNEIIDIDMSDPSSMEDLNKQRLAIMSFVRVTKNYDAARAIAEEALEAEFAAAMEALSPERQEELRAEATTEIKGQVDSMRDQWIEEGLTEEQIQTFQEVLIEEEASRLIKGEALKLNFDPTQLTGEKKAMWDIYQDAFNVKDEFFELTDEQWDTVKKEILINAPLIILSGGTASLIRAGVSRGTVAVAARIGINATRALEASRALRIGAGAAGLLVEGAAFEYSHSTLAYGLGLEEHHILELGAYEQVERVLWSTAALGLFHGVGSGIQKGAQRSATRAASRELGITSTTGMTKESMKLLEAEAAKISAGPVRTVVQATIAVNAEAGAMMVLAAAQEGVYKGNLDEFWKNFGDHVFHSYTAVLSLKAGGAVATPIQGRLKSSYEKFKAERTEKRGPEGENLRTIEAPLSITDRAAQAKEKAAESKKETEEIHTEISEGIIIIEQRAKESNKPETIIFDHPISEQSRWERVEIRSDQVKRDLSKAAERIIELGEKVKRDKAEKPEAESTKVAERVVEEAKAEYSEARQKNQMSEILIKAHELGQWAYKQGSKLTGPSVNWITQTLSGFKSKLGELTVDGVVGGVEFVLKIESALISYQTKAETARRKKTEERRRAEEEATRIETERLAAEKARIEAERMEAERLATEKLEAERIALEESRKLEELREQTRQRKKPSETFSELLKTHEIGEIGKDVMKESWFKIETKLEVEGRVFYFSEVVNHSGRLEAIAFTPINGRMEPRLFYRSFSDGGWRSCPAKIMGHFYKGKEGNKGGGLYSQETRPVEAIADHLRTNERNAQMIDKGPSTIFGHNASEGFKNIQTYNQEVSIVTAKEIQNLSPLHELSNLHKSNGGTKPLETGLRHIEGRIENANQHLRNDPSLREFMPNFSEAPKRSYEANHTILGNGVIRIYEGKINSAVVEWHMAHYKSSDTVVIDSIRVKENEMTSFGTYTHQFDAGFLTAKPVEYRSQAISHENYSEALPSHIERALPKGSQGDYVSQKPLLDRLLPVQMFRQQSLGQNINTGTNG